MEAQSSTDQRVLGQDLGDSLCYSEVFMSVRACRQDWSCEIISQYQKSGEDEGYRSTCFPLFVVLRDRQSAHSQALLICKRNWCHDVVVVVVKKRVG